MLNLYIGTLLLILGALFLILGGMVPNPRSATANYRDEFLRND